MTSLLHCSRKIGFTLEEKEADYPDWLSEINYLDESSLRSEDSALKNEIAVKEARRKEIRVALEMYSSKKAVLCTKDHELESVAVEMLEEMLEMTERFEDAKEEDLRYDTGETTFLFEVKGTTGNLKRQHISKTNNHVQICEDDFEEHGIARDVKGILAVSTEIEKSPSARAPFPDTQLSIAEREGVAVITTQTSLNEYQRYQTGDFDKQLFLDTLKSGAGLIEFNPLN